MESFWILGAGHFGSLAVKRILQSGRDCSLLVVDHDAKPLNDLRDKDLEIIEKDAIDFLLTQQGLGPEWIVPAIPEHVAFVWLCRQLARQGTVIPLAAPSELDLQIPNPIRAKTGALYTSFATFRCPDNCDEPEEICSVTGKRREAQLYQLIQHIEVPEFITLVIRSHQLAPGVGGYRLLALWHLLDTVRSTEKKIIVSTACRCHGVINALRFDRSAN